MTHVVGIDVSKAKLDCLWLREPDTRKVKTKVLSNDRKGHAALANWMTKTISAPPESILVVMEATGVYHEQLAMALYEKGFQVAVVNPAQLKAFGKSRGNTHKTDKQDSLMIALYGAAGRVPLWQPEPREIRVLKALNARLHALEVDKQREENRLEKAKISASSSLVIESIELMLAELAKEIRRIEREILEHIDGFPQLKSDKKLLESIPGIGPVLTRIMLGVIHSRDFKNAKQVAAYLGLIPVHVESGVFKGRSTLSKKGPASVRAKLYMAAVSAIKWNVDIAEFNRRMIERGKTKMEALGASMRKLVHICFGVIKNQTPYSPQAI